MDVRYVIIGLLILSVVVTVANPVTEGRIIDKFDIYAEDGLSRVDAYIFEGSGYSMPDLEEDELYICIEQSSYKVDDIVAYKIFRNGQDKIIGHRIREIQGDFYFISGDFYERRLDRVHIDDILCKLQPQPIE